MLIKVRGGVHGDVIDTKLHEKRDYQPVSRAISLAAGCKHSKGVWHRALWAFLGGENKHHIFTLNLLLALLPRYWHKIAKKTRLSACFTSNFAGRRVQHGRGVWDRALWAFLGGENKHHIFTLNPLLALLPRYWHKIAKKNAIIRLFHEQFRWQQGANTAGGCGIGRYGRF